MVHPHKSEILRKKLIIMDLSIDTSSKSINGEIQIKLKYELICIYIQIYLTQKPKFSNRKSVKYMLSLPFFDSVP